MRQESRRPPSRKTWPDGASFREAGLASGSKAGAARRGKAWPAKLAQSRPITSTARSSCSAASTASRRRSTNSCNESPTGWHESTCRPAPTGPNSCSPNWVSADTGHAGHTLIAMPVEYVPPLRDIRFVLEHIVDLPGLAKLEAYRHADPETVYGVLEESGRFMADVLGPLNRVGDTHGCSLDSDGNVTTPPGFKEAYRRYADAGWG